MSNEANQEQFRISQGFDVAQLKSGNALPIPLDDWNNLKTSVQKLDTESSFFRDVGLLLIGAGISTLITILTGTFAVDPAKKFLPIATSVVCITLSVGICCLVFAAKVKRFIRSRAADVVGEMSRIEQRFEFKG